MLSPTSPREVEVYARMEIEPAHASGSTIVTTDGRRYLDLYGGHAVAVSGHCHPKVVAAVQEQAGRMLFYSNAVPFTVRDQLMTLLTELAPPSLRRAFLVNSGAEANDVALQLARRVTGRRHIVTIDGGFHGRSLATLAASGMAKYRGLAERSGGGRLVELTRVAPWDAPEGIIELVDDTVACVILEPIQGLAGARDLGDAMLRAARRATDEAGSLLVFDEVQCGCGRPGAFTAAETYGVTPDILTMAKGIAGGLPMGAVLMGEEIAGDLKVDDLGTTFGGGPVPCAAALANLEVVRDESLPARALALEKRIRSAVAKIAPVLRVSGRGLLLGLLLDRPARPVQQALLERGFLLGNATDPNVLRLLPPLVLSDAEADAFTNTLPEVLQ
jgi:acetylornithine/N-succinyldiaminopimelate aminotransferase